VPCGQSRHIVRWEAGTLRLPSHPDAEAELVLAALGGEKARCVELAEAWGRHAEDLSVLAFSPPSAASTSSASASGWLGSRSVPASQRTMCRLWPHGT